jgi:hypothetical protein
MSEVILPATYKEAAKSGKSAPFKTALCMGGGGISPMYGRVSAETLNALRLLDSCAVANAVETFDVRLRNEGFSAPCLCCRFPKLPPMVGYATTLRLRASSPPWKGRSYLDRTDWWRHMEVVPVPRVAVIQDMDNHAGRVEVAGLKVRPGDLLHGDQNGLIRIPLEIATKIPDVASCMQAHLCSQC